MKLLIGRGSLNENAEAFKIPIRKTEFDYKKVNADNYQ
jgi:hypothetical protein